MTNDEKQAKILHNGISAVVTILTQLIQLARGEVTASKVVEITNVVTEEFIRRLK